MWRDPSAKEMNLLHLARTRSFLVKRAATSLHFMQEPEKQYGLCSSSLSSAFYFSTKPEMGRRLGKTWEEERKAEKDKNVEEGMQTKKERRKE